MGGETGSDFEGGERGRWRQAGCRSERLTTCCHITAVSSLPTGGRMQRVAVVWREDASWCQGSEVILGRWVGERAVAAVSLQNSISALDTTKYWMLTGHRQGELLCVVAPVSPASFPSKRMHVR